MSRKKVRITKNTVIKAIKAEYLVPNAWYHDFNKDGKTLNGNSDRDKINMNCAVCAVGSIICGLQKSGKIKRAVFPEVLADNDVKVSKKYLKTLAQNGLPMTALSDYFESLCEEAGIDGYDWETYLVTAKSSHSTAPEKVHAKAKVKEFEKKMRPIKQKLIRFVESHFPYYIEVKKETEAQKKKALKGTGYNVYGNLISEQDAIGW